MGNYKKIADEEQINNLLGSAFAKHLPVRVVRRDGDRDNDFFIRIKSLRAQEKQGRTVLFEVDDGDAMDYIRLKSPVLCFFIEAGAAYYMRLEWLEMESRGVVCKVPKLIYRVQRRRFFRVDVFGRGIRCGFSEPDKERGLVVRDVIDVGVGGCAVRITESDTGWMKLGNVIPGFKLKIGPNHYISPIAAVRFIGVVTLGDGQRHHKCGIEFVKMETLEEKELSYFVYSLQRTEDFKRKPSKIK
ncbi:MAG: hypothetical protein JXA66_00635 [Oligoflexia bacterium]|nr:hypothetical protein [Oligoflexia bacterium]